MLAAHHVADDMGNVVDSYAVIDSQFSPAPGFLFSVNFYGVKQEKVFGFSSGGDN